MGSNRPIPSQADPSLLEEFRTAVSACADLYRESGEYCARQHPHLIRSAPADFVELMDDLHKGLLIKIYIGCVQADRKWNEPERELAQLLFHHLWSRSLQGTDLRDATHKMAQQAAELKWIALIRPFMELTPLRDRVGELETLVMRIANLVVAADGTCSVGERHFLRDLQAELDRHLYRLPFEESVGHEESRRREHQAIDAMPQDAKEVRDLCEIPATRDELPPPSPAEQLQNALKKLDALIGMENIKEEVRSLTNFLRMQQERTREGLPTTAMSLHLICAGNPGTGKTTVARLVGEIFRAMGILEKGHVVEVDRSALVAEYAGQTGPKTNRVLDEALDGILFIDEAYSLVGDQGQDHYGNEAVQTLLKRMEDCRSRLVVILAGYPEPMKRLLQSNPGLSSRFARQMHFPDYTPEQLGRIFHQLAETNQFDVPLEVRRRLLWGFHWVHANRDEHFGNGRLVRNLFESAIRQLANRIAGIAPVTRELLTRLQPDDIIFSDVPAEAWPGDSVSRRYRIACPGCGQASEVNEDLLVRKLTCKRCACAFTAEWGEPCPTANGS